MITMEMIGKVKRIKLREQLSNSEIAKRTGLSRNTVKKCLKAPGDQAPMPQQAETSLQLSQVPVANTARYDGLRSGLEVTYD